MRNANKHLCAWWIGPFPVEEVINARTYKLELPDTYRIKNVFNVSQLKACYDSSLPQLTIETDDSGIDHIIHEIDEIVSHVMKGRRHKTLDGILVHFKGYTSDYNMWQTVNDIATSAPHLLQDYTKLHNLMLDQKSSAIFEKALEGLSA